MVKEKRKDSKRADRIDRAKKRDDKQDHRLDKIEARTDKIDAQARKASAVATKRKWLVILIVVALGAVALAKKYLFGG